MKSREHIRKQELALEELRQALSWCLQHLSGHERNCNLNQQSRWDEAQHALNDCYALPEARGDRQAIAHAQAEINVKRNVCTCGYWDGLRKAEFAIVLAAETKIKK